MFWVGLFVYEQTQKAETHSVHVHALNLIKVWRILLVDLSSSFSPNHHVFSNRAWRPPLPPTVVVSVMNKQWITCTHHGPQRTGAITKATIDISTFKNDTKLGKQQLQCTGKAGQWPNTNSWTRALCLLLDSTSVQTVPRQYSNSSYTHSSKDVQRYGWCEHIDCCYERLKRDTYRRKQQCKTAL